MAELMEIERCRPSSHKSVLALAAQAWPLEERAGQWQSMADCIRGGKEDRLVLLAARRGEQLLAAALGQLLEGRSAVVWLPQIEDLPSSEQIAKDAIGKLLLDQLAMELRAGGAEIAQALLAADASQGATLLRSSGFEHAADLLYLTADVHPAEGNDAPPMGLEFAAFRTSDELRLIDLVERTYVGTLDCPGMDGVRDTADVLGGYRAVGRFDPHLWQFARLAGRDVGCLLVNVHPDVGHAEIVYLAVVPEVRGQRLGQKLVEQAHRLARAENCNRLVLAVDATNDPAIAMYVSCGFLEWDRRVIWIRRLRKP